MMYENDPLGRFPDDESVEKAKTENPDGDYEENDVELEDGSDDLVSPDADEGVDNLE